MSSAPLGTPCILLYLSMGISFAMLHMRQPICCDAKHMFPGSEKRPRILTMLHCLTGAILMRMQSMLGLFFLHE